MPLVQLGHVKGLVKCSHPTWCKFRIDLAGCHPSSSSLPDLTVLTLSQVAHSSSSSSSSNPAMAEWHGNRNYTDQGDNRARGRGSHGNRSLSLHQNRPQSAESVGNNYYPYNSYHYNQYQAPGHQAFGFSPFVATSSFPLTYPRSLLIPQQQRFTTRPSNRGYRHQSPVNQIAPSMSSRQSQGQHDSNSSTAGFNQSVAVASGQLTANQWLETYMDTRTPQVRTRHGQDEIKSLVNSFRTWYYTLEGKKYLDAKRSSPQKLSKGAVEFTFMTYNVLSQDLIQHHPDLYTHCSKKSLDWECRSKQLIFELSQTMADIVCLQEVHAEHFKSIYEPFLRGLGYEGMYKKRTGGDKMDGCALFYKTSKFLLDYAVKLEFNQKSVCHLLNRDNVGLVARFCPIDGDKNSKLVVATTHLLFNPKRGDVKLAQLRYLLAEIGKLTKCHESSTVQGDYPVLLCGDMNTLPGSPIYRFLNNGELNPVGWRSGELSGQLEDQSKGPCIVEEDLKMVGVDMNSAYTPTKPNEGRTAAPGGQSSAANSVARSKLTHEFNFTSVYPIDDSKQNPYVSTDHQKASALVDYIFYTRHPSVSLLGYQKLLTSDEMKQIGSLPNDHLGSDHLSLTAKFLLKPF